jgi:hypothetical protein
MAMGEEWAAAHPYPAASPSDAKARRKKAASQVIAAPSWKEGNSDATRDCTTSADDAVTASKIERAGVLKGDGPRGRCAST